MKSEVMKRKETDAATQIIREQLRYKPRLGDLIWIGECDDKYSSLKGQIAGRKTRDIWGCEYLSVSVFSRSYRAHRIAWLLYYGDWPEDQIDHQDGNGLNNKIGNLRCVTNSENARNTKGRKNSSGHRGVRWHSIGKRWNARIMVQKREYSLGLYDDIQDAIKARLEAEKRFGFHENHGRPR